MTSPGIRIENEIWAGIGARMAAKRRRRFMTGFSSVMVVAASILLGVMLWHGHEKPENKKLGEPIAYYADSDMNITLPDGTSVYLQGGSALNWIAADVFDRTVQLHGDAIFDVTSTPDKADFVVSTPEGIITVKGTSFSVNSHEENVVSVTLFSGKVDFTAVKSGQVVSLQPMNTLTCDANTSEINVRPSFKGVTWSEGRFVIENASIQDVVEFLKWRYSADITIGSGIRTPLFVGQVLPDDKLDQVLDKFCFMMNMRCDRKGDSYHIHR